MQQNKIEKTGNLLAMERSASLDIPLNHSLKNCLVSIVGEKYSEPIESLLKSTNKSDLLHLTLDELKQNGFTLATAKKVMGAIQFGLTLHKLPSTKGDRINSPKDAASLLDYLSNETQEHFVVLFLNVKNQVISRKTIFIGSLNASVVHPREIMREAVKCSCASIIVSHNHPSGNPDPSPEDIEVTNRLAEAGRIVGIELLDHLIIGHGKFLSLKEKGYFQ